MVGGWRNQIFNRFRPLWAWLGAAALLASATAQAHVRAWPAGQVAAAGRELQMGALTLHGCGHGAFCGRLDRPLDPLGLVAGTLPIVFEFYRHTGPRGRGTLVATEGGPGYPATGSRGDYLALFGPLMTDRDVLIMDNRGTGRSGAIDCHDLQTGVRWTVDSVAACGRSLGERAPLYSTAYAADDLAALLQALGVGPIDLYGDSYGTYFEQVFAVRHPALLRSLVLDGAYPLTGRDYAWYPSYAPAMRDKFDIACRRSPGCAALPGTSMDHIQPALDRLRAGPYPATAYDVNGQQRRIRADASQLAIVLYGSAPALTTVREADAAARAFVADDPAPLQRLMAETAAAVDSRDPSGEPAQWSAGLAAAVMCQDPPQIFDMRLSPAERLLDRDRKMTRRRREFPDTYAPFTIDEYRGMPLDYSFLDQCIGWPVADEPHAAAQIGLDAVYPDVPALIISGELDNITTSADGAAVAAAFPRGVQVRIANGFHVNALPRARSACAAQIVRHFLADRQPGNTACAEQALPVRLVPRFALAAKDIDPALAVGGNAAGDGQLRVVRAALLTLGDVLARVDSNSSGVGRGLRGGSYRIQRRAGRVQIALSDLRWVRDLAVSGAVSRPTRRQGVVEARLRLDGPLGIRGWLRVRWLEGRPEPVATLDGRWDGAVVKAVAAAP